MIHSYCNAKPQGNDFFSGWTSRNAVEGALFHGNMQFFTKKPTFSEKVQDFGEIRTFHGIPSPESTKQCSNSVCFQAAGRESRLLPKISQILVEIHILVKKLFFVEKCDFQDFYLKSINLTQAFIMFCAKYRKRIFADELSRIFIFTCNIFVRMIIFMQIYIFCKKQWNFPSQIVLALMVFQQRARCQIRQVRFLRKK